MDIHVARQPIFDASQNVFAYELLYRRSGASNMFDNTEEDEASSNVIIDSFLGIGINTLTGGKKAFINFTGTLLEKEVATLFPNDILVIEVLETVSVDPTIVDKCKALKQAGYLIALDDFILSVDIIPLIEIADIIKIDFLSMTHNEIECIVKRLKRPGLKFLAEKIETKEDFALASEMGFSYFQGYFFSKPVIISEQGLRPLPINYFRMIQEANASEISFHNIGKIIQLDVSLSYKLLWMVNTVGFGYVHKIKSVQHALVALGEIELRKWISLIALMGINQDQPQELLYASLIRARFAELLALGLRVPHSPNTLFMMGLFSLMESIMHRPFESIFKDVFIEEPVRDALQHERGPLYPVISLIIAQERGQWDAVSKLCDEFNVSSDWVSTLYVEALRWCNSILSFGVKRSSIS